MTDAVVDPDEIERISVTLARLADTFRRTPPPGRRDGSYAAPPTHHTIIANPVIPPPSDGCSVTAGAIARRYLRRRRARDVVLPVELFDDVDWWMVLELFAAECEGRLVSVTSLCLAVSEGGTAPTTALRHLCRLETLGIMTRTADPDDRRRFFMRLMPDIGPKVERWLVDTWPELT